MADEAVDWGREPAYKQVAERLRRRIKQQNMQAGDTLPSLAEIQEAHGVSITVARLAIKELKTEGLVKVVPGKGNLVADPEASSQSEQFEQAMRQIVAMRKRSERMADHVAALEGRLADLERRVDGLAQPSSRSTSTSGRRGQQ